MQATLAVHNRPLPQVPTRGKTTKTNPIAELNCTTTRTPRLPLAILNRSTPRSPPTPKSTKQTKTPSLPHIGNLPSLYSHSNHSGDLLSGSRSPIALVRSSPALSISTHHRIAQRRLPTTSLLRSRRKLWKKYWLVIDLPTVPELSENIHEIEIESMHLLRSRSGMLVPRKPPLSELQSTRPLSRYPPRVVTESLPPPPPPPELDDDTGSESSSSDEDLDAYEFDLSCCPPSWMDLSVDVPIQPKDSRLKVGLFLSPILDTHE